MALDRRAVLAGALLSSVPAAAIASLSEEEALLRDEEKAVEKLDSAIKGDLLDEKKIQIEIKKQSEALAKATQADDKDAMAALQADIAKLEARYAADVQAVKELKIQEKAAKDVEMKQLAKVRDAEMKENLRKEAEAVDVDSASMM